MRHGGRHLLSRKEDAREGAPPSSRIDRQQPTSLRDLLTGLAIILIVVLTTLLVAPYFVDWNGQRGFLEAQLSRALGQKVTIGGDIDLKLLPTPYLRLSQTVIGADDAALRVGIRHLDFELAVAPLLHGEIDVVEGRLEQPAIRLTLLPDRSLPAVPGFPSTRLDVRLERIAIVDGTIAVADPQSGRTFTADHLDATIEASSLDGPFKGSGTQGSGPARSRFRFSTAPARHSGRTSRTRLRFALDETVGHPALDLDGDVAPTGGTGSAGGSFEGTLTAEGHLRPDGRAPIGWHLAGPLKLGAADASFGGGELRIGDGDDDLVFSTEVQASLAAAPSAHARLIARQLDIDRLSGPPAAKDGAPGAMPPPLRLPNLAALRGLIEAAAPPLPVTVETSIESAVWGGQALNGIEARFTLGAATPQPLHASGEGPGNLHLVLDGDPGGSSGRLDLSAGNLPGALAWLRGVAPVGLPLGAAPPPFHSAGLAARFTARDGALALDGLTLKLDRSTLQGSARLAWPARPDGPPTVVADLSTPALDIDALPELSQRAGAADHRATAQVPLDLALKLDAGSVKVAQAGSGPLSTGHLHFEGRRSTERLAVDALDIEDLGGATLHASGAIGNTAASLDLDVDAARVEAAATLLQQLAPGRAAEALAHRAASLAPAKLHLAATLARDRQGTLVTSRLDAAGQFAATALDVHLAPDGDRMRLHARAEAPQGEGLLRQIGLPLAPGGDGAPARRRLGAARLALDGVGPLDGPLDTSVEAAFGGSHLRLNGAFQLFGAGRGGSGELTLASPDAVPLLLALGLASPDARDLLPASLAGGLALSQTSVAVSDLKGSIGGGRVAGTLRWRSVDGATPDAPALTGSLDLDRLSLGSLAALLLGPSRPPVAGLRANGAAWSDDPFAAGLAAVPRSLVTLHARTLDLGLGPVARDATLDVASAPDFLGLKHLDAALAGGRVEAEGTLRRDGTQATLAGSVSLKGVALDIPAAKAGIAAKLDVAGGGATPLALVASLAGSGEATLAETVLPGFEPRALAKVFADTESDALSVDAESVKRAFAAANARQGASGQGPAGRAAAGKAGAALALGALPLAASLASGVLTLGPQREPTPVGPISAAAIGSYDLRRLSGRLAVTETLRDLPKDWSGERPSLTVTEDDLPGAARRSLDVGDFINAVAARAIARETARIEAFEFDVRERALFNARLIFDRRREQDRQKAEADAKAAEKAAADKAEAARRGEAEKRAKAEAAPDPLPHPAQRQPLPPFAAPSDPSTAGRY